MSKDPGVCIYGNRHLSGVLRGVELAVDDNVVSPFFCLSSFYVLSGFDKAT